MQYPDYFNYYNVPYQYQSFYPDGDDATATAMATARSIRSIRRRSMITHRGAADRHAVRSASRCRRPTAPTTCRSPIAAQYYDTPDAWYRYNDGYIYRVDPTTQLITAIINAIV